MEQETIKFQPYLHTAHKIAFTKFCKELLSDLEGKNDEEKEAILLTAKEKLNKRYSGINFHDNVELSFTKSLMLDLLLQDWQMEYGNGGLKIVLDELNGDEKHLDLLKAKIRRRHLLARNAQLREPSTQEFIKNMERRRPTETGWHSIFSLMRDGISLAEVLRTIRDLPELEQEAQLKKTISPYIQFVEPGIKCKHTGLNLSDIWRYFRHTWINEYKSLPGRSIFILVRDAAAPNHPVIGIAALGSSVAQQSCRDQWIEWDGKTFMQKLIAEPSAKYGKWVLQTIDDLLNDIYKKDFYDEGILSLKEIRRPTLEKIKELKELSKTYRTKHTDNPHKSKFNNENDSMSWEDRAKTYLFKSKRAIYLSEILSIRYILQKYDFFTGGKRELQKSLQIGEFRNAIEKLARKAKSVHVGINMMDIIVCGSIAPYNHILGGKLVCMLLTSPEVNQYYNEKYAKYVSLIASSMKGKPLVREPQLVFLGTTSLYGVGSSQYNRIKIPMEELEGEKGTFVEYKNIGFSEGFGSFHFSNSTIKLADAVVGINQGKKRVNSIFGEGANPLLRKIKDAIEIMELESRPILNHRNKRVVYGIALAKNFRDILIGTADKPNYLIPQSKPKHRTRLIGEFWIKRWLSKRIYNDDVLNEVSTHGLSYPMEHGAKVPVMTTPEVLTLF